MKPREELHYKQVYPHLDVNKRTRVDNSLFASTEIVDGKSSLTKDDKRALEIQKTAQKKWDDQTMTLNNLRTRLIKQSDRLKPPKINLDAIDYNLDVCDLRFLNDYNLGVSKSEFELIMDRMEKEWYFFKQKIVKNSFIPFDLTSEPCNICSFIATTPNNNLIYCDGCNIAVHQECYGVPIIPSGPWFCKPCLFQIKYLTCRFCQKPGGAFKMTNQNNWAHVVCVLWNENLFFSNVVFMEPIEEPEQNELEGPPQRCNICRSYRGQKIKCAYLECCELYHVTCAIDSEYYMDCNNMITYCPIHNPLQPLEYCDDLNFYPEIKKRPKLRHFVHLAKPKRSLLLHIKMFHPFVSTYFVDKIYCNDICNLNIKKEDLIAVLLYWYKKKKALNPVPFIPYLSLESGSGLGTDWYEKRALFCLKDDVPEHEQPGAENIIEKLTDLKKKDSVKKQTNNLDLSIDSQQAAVLEENNELNESDLLKNEQPDDFLELQRKIKEGCGHKKVPCDKMADSCQFIYDSLKINEKISEEVSNLQKTKIELRDIQKELVLILLNRKRYLIDFIMAHLDRPEFELFKEPVTEDIAPSYFEIIEQPMDFSKIYKKAPEYDSLESFFDNLKLIGENCKKYNAVVPFLVKLSNNFLKEVSELQEMANECLEEVVDLKLIDIFQNNAN
ncbi:PHD finger protein BR140/LIN-49 [Pseudoloma neurophilia]|uniref:PHD finger protein BR140/LIN-49 n=1 Tax=Pseudoloma neurophilia TaxID=146866 RepID=A0A0R0M4K3_9MICR|nr:PHD finger protein BR140/LIN-49 [Pseudoloma neurophilia]